jgi:hypothetical protein
MGLTQTFADAVVEAEGIITGAPFVAGDQDLAEGYDYLAGSIRASLQQAWAYERDYPFFTLSVGPYTKMGLDNPDTLYFHAYLRHDAEYVVNGVRGSTADLSFQVLKGDYSPVDVPGSVTAFDDREIDVADDGSFELRLGPGEAGRNYVHLPEGSTMLVVREVYSDWATERRGDLRIHRVDTAGTAPVPPDKGALEKRYRAAGKILLSRLRTFIEFPTWFYYDLPVNTLTEPRSTPGGLTTQWSSVGHYELDDDTAMVITVPRPLDVPYFGLQLGSVWYVSLDYVNHQTSLTADQARTDPDGMIRYVVSERNPGVANWIECTGHRRGIVQFRWQRTSRDLTPDDGPTAELVPFGELAKRLPYYEESRVDEDAWKARIAARQEAVARRMLG